MTPRQKLIKICELKALLIKEHTGIEDYFTEEDRADIMSWDKDVCRQISDRILYNLKYAPRMTSDGSICAWCVFYKCSPRQFLYRHSLCDLCSYGKRHKICAKPNSKYKKIIKNFKDYLYIVNIPTLLQKIKKILEKD